MRVPSGRIRVLALQLLAATVTLLLTFTGCGDQVALGNTSGSENGILANGQESGGAIAYKSFKSTGSSVDVGDLSPRAGNNEVVGFTNLRPPAILTPVTWTTNRDTVNLAFQNQIGLAFKVWIVKGPFDAQRTRAINSCITTSTIWDHERMGTSIATFEIVDATGNSNASNYFAFDCSKQAGIQNDIGKTTGRINIYFVDTVDGGSGRGQACNIGSDFVALGSAVGSELASHELGHDFGLTHVDDLTASFDQTDIMHSASNTRQFITEGQLFRAHLSANSALNFLYAARPGQPTRDCPRDTSNDQCPPIDRRIWADGTFAAN